MAGIYIHIPFCKQACHYCDFHFSTSLTYKAELLNALREIHRAAKAEKVLDTAERRKLFQTTLQWEQETTVAPKVKEEIAKFDCPVLKRLVLKPFVRFSYFPRFKMFWFKNFSDTTERIRNAHECFEIAERVGEGS